ncbi:hypothetical protein [Edaphosphingomonas haloaromaticamans]|uniref:Uncharacterized protein n=1 Tax=Edaphosphingomonas haloaromaticamans TaxID=653954 RepID=A0A1S1HGX2_9SPHN|nr:hypothetical protein [Sphingomonas haloaromaticamans]OHT20483.1 hypothetical protein BHE75_02481 [Sphingomonas haloaromaticamans]
MATLPADAPTLSKLEWQAVAIGLREVDGCGCGSIEPPSRFRRLWTTLTGAEAVRPLADPRLEALRRFVCRLRRSGEDVEKLGQELIALGYSRNQVSAIAALDRP